MIPLAPSHSDIEARRFCEAFMSSQFVAPRLVLGTNAFAASLAEHAQIDGFINEFAEDQTEFLGRPLYHSLIDVPDEALVVSAVVLGRPHTALRKLKDRGLRHIDYFGFAKNSGLPLLHTWDPGHIR